MSPSPFTYDEYRYILERLREKGYYFDNYREALNMSQDPNVFKYVVIRHDVDISLDKALCLALIEARMEISATYFILLDTMGYNLHFEPENSVLSEIRDLGHKIGLHFHLKEDDTERETNQKFETQRQTLQNWVNMPIDVMTFHVPHKLSKPMDVMWDIINASDEPFLTKIRYFSDGWGSWRFGHPLESKEFAEGKPLHLSFHPVWWNEQSTTPLISIKECVDDHMDQFKWYVAQNLMGF